MSETDTAIGRAIRALRFARSGLLDLHGRLAPTSANRRALDGACGLIDQALAELAPPAPAPAPAVVNPAPPRIVCLCGSTRFWREFQEASLREALAGRIVLSIGCARCADDDDKSFGGYVPVGQFDRAKAALDELHLRKIDLADEVLVLNVGGYVGPSTRAEIDHATRTGKPVRYLEPA